MVVAPDPVWERVTAELAWDTPPERAWSDGDWFVGGRLNASVVALDQHLAHSGPQVALYWEGEPGDHRALTYNRLHTEVVALAAALRGLGVGEGDHVALHMGLVPETVIAILACARIGAVHAVMPAVLPVESIADRLEELRPRVVVTQDGAWRHGVMLPLKARVDEAVTAVGTIEHTVVVRRTGIDVAWYEGDRWFHDLVAHADPGQGMAVPVAADHPYLVTWLANRRGRPVGLVHETAGMVVFSLAYQQLMCPDGDEVLWVPSEVAWMATQTHGILGPLAGGGTAVIYEGMLDVPDHQRIWDIVARYDVTTVMATPSVVRAVRRWVHDPPDSDLVASLRRVVTAGEPVTDDTETWLQEEVGRGHLEVANAWGQTQLGGATVLTSRSPMSLRLPDPGLAVVDEAGRPVPDGVVGDLVLTRAWPSISRPLADEEPAYGWDSDRRDVLVTGDRARVHDGRLEVLGRSDRVFSVSGQLVSATEVVDVLMEHPWVLAAEVVDRSDARRGRAVVAFVAVTADAPDDDLAVARELTEHVHETLGGLAAPKTVVLVDEFPDESPGRLRRGLESLAATVDAVGRVSRSRLTAAITATEGSSGPAGPGGTGSDRG